MKRSMKQKSQNERQTKRARTTLETVETAQQKLNKALLEAAQRGDEKEMISLLEQGADPNAKGHHGDTALLDCARDNLVNAAQILLKKGADINAATIQTGMTPLHYAVIYNNLDMVRFLIENQANVNLKNYLGHTPLHCGIDTTFGLRDDEDEVAMILAEILLEADTDISLVDEKGVSTLALMQERAALGPVLVNHYQNLLSLPKVRSLKDIMAEKVSKLLQKEDIFQGQSADLVLPIELIEYTTLVTPLLEHKRAIIRNNLQAYHASTDFQQCYKENVEKNEKKITP